MANQLLLRQLALGDADEAAQPGLGREQVVVARIARGARVTL